MICLLNFSILSNNNMYLVSKSVKDRDTGIQFDVTPADTLDPHQYAGDKKFTNMYQRYKLHTKYTFPQVFFWNKRHSCQHLLYDIHQAFYCLLSLIRFHPHIQAGILLYETSSLQILHSLKKKYFNSVKGINRSQAIIQLFKGPDRATLGQPTVSTKLVWTQ